MICGLWFSQNLQLPTIVYTVLYNNNKPKLLPHSGILLSAFSFRPSVPRMFAICSWARFTGRNRYADKAGLFSSVLPFFLSSSPELVDDDDDEERSLKKGRGAPVCVLDDTRHPVCLPPPKAARRCDSCRARAAVLVPHQFLFSKGLGGRTSDVSMP